MSDTTIRLAPDGVPGPTASAAPAAMGEAGQAGGFHVPGYTIVGELARGGMGAVYQARQLRPEREVALKVLLPQYAREPEMLARFQIEARAMATLDHPGILPVYEVGEVDGMPFFSMKLAAGGSLADRLKNGPLPPRTAAELLSQLARAVHHAHQHGMLHRDLKPGNFLFDEAGRPYVSDFGLAKLPLTSTPSALTRTEAFFGTPHYMPPEVACGSMAEATTSGDLYSLGAVLYECLCGKTPHGRHESVGPLLRAIVDEPVPPLREICQAIPRDLEIICLKALEKQPAARYAGTAEFADDLDRWRSGHPILARPAGLLEKAGRWAVRHPLPAALALGLIMVSLAGGTLLAFSYRDRGAALQEARLRLHRSLLDQARAERLLGEAGHRSRALALLHQAADLAPSPEIRDEAAALLVRPDLDLLTRSATATPLAGEKGWPQAAGEVDPVTGGRKSGRWILTFHDSGKAALWQDGEMAPQREWPAEEGRRVLGGFCATAHGPGLLLVQTAEGSLTFDLQTMKAVARLPDSGSAVSFLTVHPAGGGLALGRSDGLEVMDFREGRLVWKDAAGAVRCPPAWSPDGHLLGAALGSERGLTIFESGSGFPVWKTAMGGWPVSLAFHPDRPWIAVAGDDGSVSLLDLTARRTWGRLPVAARAVAFEDRGHLLIAEDDHGQRHTWRVQDPVACREWRAAPGSGTPGAVFGLTFSPDGRRLLTTAVEGVRIWDTGEGRELGFHPAENQRIDAPTSAWWLSDHSLLVQVPGGLEQVDVDAAGRPGPPRRVPRMPGTSVIEVDPSGTWLVKITDPDAGDSREYWPGGDPSQSRPAPSADHPKGAGLARAVHVDGEAQLLPDDRIHWQPRGSPDSAIHLTSPEPLGVQAMAFDPRGQRLVVLGRTHRLMEWNLPALEQALGQEGF